MNASQRCDRCGAQAYVMTLHSGNSLYWCNHHYTAYEELLEPALYIDARERLTADK